MKRLGRSARTWGLVLLVATRVGRIIIRAQWTVERDWGLTCTGAGPLVIAPVGGWGRVRRRRFLGASMQ